MKFTTVLALATAVAGVTAAPAVNEAEAEINARTSGGIECCKIDGKWHWGWSGAKPSQEYICATGGLLVSIT